MEKTVVVNKGEEVVDLPPGFRFHPTDEEIIVNYLTEKVKNSSFSSCAIGEVDLNKCEPWDLPRKAKMGEKEFYFFCQRDRKYPTGMRTNRATEAGYWKATGKDKEIYREKNFLVGMKKTLVFYKGRAPKGEKTNWVMHEYRLEGKFNYYTLVKAAKDAWVVCRVFHKSTGIKKTPIHELLRVNTFGDDLLDYASPPPLIELPTNMPSSSCFSGDDSPSDIKRISSNPRSCEGNYNGKSNYFSQSFNMVNNDHMQVPITSYQKPFISSNVYNPQVQVPNPSFNIQNSPNIPNNSFQSSSFGGNGETILRDPFGLDKDKLYKVEQFSSNQAMVSLSQETGVSTDMNTTEISSVASKQEMGSTKGFEDLEDPSIGPISDLECLWDCWSK